MYPAELNPQVLALVAGVVLASWGGLGVRLGLRRRRRDRRGDRRRATVSGA